MNFTSCGLYKLGDRVKQLDCTLQYQHFRRDLGTPAGPAGRCAAAGAAALLAHVPSPAAGSCLRAHAQRQGTACQSVLVRMIARDVRLQPGRLEGWHCPESIQRELNMTDLIPILVWRTQSTAVPHGLCQSHMRASKCFAEAAWPYAAVQVCDACISSWAPCWALACTCRLISSSGAASQKLTAHLQVPT